MNKAVFADAGYWIALFNAKDDLHQAAIQASKEIANRPIVSSEMVIAEFLNEFSASGQYLRTLAVRFVEELQETENIVIAPQTPELFAAAFQLYATRPDKHWSLTDCASMTICQSEDITEVLAHDRHFEQAGFTALLRRTA